MIIKSVNINNIFRGLLLSLSGILVFTNITISQDNSHEYSLFMGINVPIQPYGFDNYYLDGISVGGTIERPFNNKWSAGVKTDYARYFPDTTAVADWQNEVSVDFKPSNAKYHVNSYAITSFLRRQFGNAKEDMRFFIEFELGPHLFTGSGWDSVPAGLREEIEVSETGVQFGVGIGSGIKWDWDDKYATFIQIGWHKIIKNYNSKSYLPLMAGIRF